MRKAFKRIAILLIAAFVSPTFLYLLPSLGSMSITEVSAATAKASLSSTKVTMGICGSPEYIFIDNYNGEAVYTFKSANEKIATVNESGFISGVSKGTTSITVTENIDGVKSVLGTVKVTIANSKLTKELDIGVNNEAYLPIQYVNLKATYKYKSSNSKIVAIDKNGTIKTLKLGKATISVTETYQGKTVKLGSVTVNVVSSKLAFKEQSVPICSSPYIDVVIDYKNPKATYNYKTSNSKVATVDKSGLIKGIAIGKTTVSVTETYNKKTRKLGSVTVKVLGAYLNPKAKPIEIGINSYNYILGIADICFVNWDAEYTCKSADSKIVSAGIETYLGASEFMVKGVSLGQTTIMIYEKYKGKTRLVGTADIIVKEFPIINFSFVPYEFEEVEGSLHRNYYLNHDYSSDSLKYYLYKDPYNCTTPVTFTSSNEAVIKVDKEGYVTLVAEGTAIITATCGEFTSELEITVMADASEDSTDGDDGEDGGIYY